MGGGTSVNAIPFGAWFEMDMRSASPSALQALDAKFHRAVDDAVKAEDARWSKKVLSVLEPRQNVTFGTAGTLWNRWNLAFLLCHVVQWRV